MKRDVNPNAASSVRLPSNGECIWLDVGDLLARADDKRLSGIVRAMASTAREFLKLRGAGVPLRFCRFVPDVGFMEIPEHKVRPLVDGLLGPELLPAPAAPDQQPCPVSPKRRIIAGLRRGVVQRSRASLRGGYLRFSEAVAPRHHEKPNSLKARLRRVGRNWEVRLLRRAYRADRIFGTNDVLLNIGASWQLPTYPEAVQRLSQTIGLRFVLLIHDVIPWRVPQYCTPTTVTEFIPWMRLSIQLATRLLTVSQNSRNDIRAFVETSGLPEKEIHVIQWGGAPGPKHQVRSRPGPRPGFVLCVGTIEVRKNHLLLARVWSRLLERHDPLRVPNLVWIGHRGWMIDRLMREIAETNFLDGKLLWLGEHHGVSDDVLNTYYDSCLFTMFPSFYEGWGLPVAESLAHGKYCIASGAPSLREVGGDLIDYHPPDDIDAWVSATERAIFDPAYRAAREERIRRDFKSPTWSECAQQIVAACQGMPAEKPETKRRRTQRADSA